MVPATLAENQLQSLLHSPPVFKIASLHVMADQCAGPVALKRGLAFSQRFSRHIESIILGGFPSKQLFQSREVEADWFSGVPVILPGWKEKFRGHGFKQRSILVPWE